MKHTKPGRPGDACQCCKIHLLGDRHSGNTRPRGPILTTVFCPACDMPDHNVTIESMGGMDVDLPT